MSDMFILQNQEKLFLGKQKEWLDGREPGSLFKTSHKDEAINQMVEVSAKDYTQRIRVLSCPLNDKGFPQLDGVLLPPPQPKKSRGQDGENDQQVPMVFTSEIDTEQDMIEDEPLFDDTDADEEPLTNSPA